MSLITSDTSLQPADSVSDLPVSSGPDQATETLIKLGGVPLERFADPVTDFEAFEAQAPSARQREVSQTLHDIPRLNQLCQRAFDSVVPLDYSFSEDPHGRKRCILTITRPGGATRSYATAYAFSRQKEAKNEVAMIALREGAEAFIRDGDDSKAKGPKLALVNLPSSTTPQDEDPQAQTKPTSDNDVDDESQPPIAEINNCCTTWRAGRVRPKWYYTIDGSDTGCALKIELSPHLTRVYSVPTEYTTRSQAKVAAAEAALRQDVIDFIQHGGGQTEPEPVAAEYDGTGDSVIPPSETVIAARTDRENKAERQKKLVSLRDFQNSLPKPYPEAVEEKLKEEPNPVVVLNQLIQQARGSKMSHSWTYIVDQRLNLHGCLLRLTVPSKEARSYLVDPVFSKRQDAKTAVSLLAIIEGAGEYALSLGKQYQDKLTPEMKEHAKEFLKQLTSELHRVRPGLHATWAYKNEKGAFGCTLSVEISDTVSRKYDVPVDYRGRGDAKSAVALQAEKEGAIEFIRFRGAPPPPGYDPLTYHSANKKSANNTSSTDLDQATPAQLENNRKRKQPEISDPPPLFETRAEALARVRLLGGNKGPPMNRANNAPLSTRIEPRSFPRSYQIPPPLGHPPHEEQSASSASTSRFVPASPRDLVASPTAETFHDENRIPLTRTPDHVPAPPRGVHEASLSRPDRSPSPPAPAPAAQARASSAAHLSAGSPVPLSANVVSVATLSHSSSFTREAVAVAPPLSSSGRSHVVDERYLRDGDVASYSYHDEPRAMMARTAYPPPPPVRSSLYDPRHGIRPTYDDQPPYDNRWLAPREYAVPAHSDYRAVHDSRYDYGRHDRGGYAMDYHVPPPPPPPRYHDAFPPDPRYASSYPPPLPPRHEYYHDHREYAPDYDRSYGSIAPPSDYYDRESLDSRRYDDYHHRAYEHYPGHHADPHHERERDPRAEWDDRARYDRHRQSYPPPPPPPLSSSDVHAHAQHARSPSPARGDRPPASPSNYTSSQLPSRKSPTQSNTLSQPTSRGPTPSPPPQSPGPNHQSAKAYPTPPAPAPGQEEHHRGRTFEPRQGRDDQRSRSRARIGEGPSRDMNGRFQTNGHDKSRDGRGSQRRNSNASQNESGNRTPAQSITYQKKSWNPSDSALPSSGVIPAAVSGQESLSNENGKRPRPASPLRDDHSQEAPASSSKPETSKQGKSPIKSYVTQLFDYCNKTNQPPPVFYSNAVTINNEVEHSVWIIMGKERLELPTTFTSLSLGQERLSKQVLSRMKQASGSKKRKVEDATTATAGRQ